MIVFLFTMISGALSFQVRPPYAESQTIQALMIDVHHSLGMVFLLLFFFFTLAYTFRIEKIKAIGIVKVGFVTFGNALFYTSLCIVCRTFVYSDFEMNMVDLLRNYDSGLFWSPLFRLSRYSLGFFEHTANLEGQQCLGDTSFFPH